MSQTCSICADTLNKSTRQNIPCCYCDFSACRSCWKQYFLNETVTKCMSPTCAKEWTRKYVAEKMTKIFVGTELKTHREEVLFDKERALLPATQIFVEREIALEALDIVRRDAIENLNNAKREYNRIVDEQYRLRRDLNRVPSREEATRVQFVRACPDGDCRGFLSSQWKCGLCQKWSCPECHEIKGLDRDTPHTCDPGNVETAKLLEKDTKSCPTCGMGIFKIEGCDQMWCTQCHTAFSFRTGRIEQNIHNPHYYEYLRRNGGGTAPRNPLDIQCGREIDNHLVTNIIRSLRIYLKCDPNNQAIARITKDFDEFGRQMIHIRRVVLPNYRVDPVLNNQGLRILYMRNRLPEDEFKIKVQQADKKYQKTNETYNIFTVLVNATTDILYRFLDEIKEPEEWVYNFDKLKEINNLLEYTDECFRDLSRTYTCTKTNIYNYVRQFELPDDPPIENVILEIK